MPACPDQTVRHPDLSMSTGNRPGKEPGGASSQGQDQRLPTVGHVWIFGAPLTLLAYLPDDDDLARLVVPLLVAMLSSQPVIRHGSLGTWQAKSTN